jgi:hypothetical protein
MLAVKRQGGGPGSITRLLRNVYGGGEQVGWLPKEISPLLLPLVQRAGEGMHVDGLVPRGSGNKFKIPLDLKIYGRMNK